MVIAGDPSQSDLGFHKHKRESGLCTLEEIVKNVNDVAVVNFGKDDIVRSPVVVDIVAAFEEYENEHES